jgi:hypothetical protein
VDLLWIFHRIQWGNGRIRTKFSVEVNNVADPRSCNSLLFSRKSTSQKRIPQQSIYRQKSTVDFSAWFGMLAHLHHLYIIVISKFSRAAATLYAYSGRGVLRFITVSYLRANNNHALPPLYDVLIHRLFYRMCVCTKAVVMFIDEYPPIRYIQIE